jgi:cell division protein ZapA
MPQVAIKIGPKTYHVRCGEGEQERLLELGALIAGKYAQLGNARAPLEAENLLFAAILMADELDEARSRAALAEKAADEARAALESALAAVELEKAKRGGQAAELQAETETLRKAEARAREEVSALKAELATMREAAQHQHDLFGTPVDEEAIVLRLEALAERAETAAAALEQGA